jgi:hypothetical protein
LEVIIGVYLRFDGGGQLDTQSSGALDSAIERHGRQPDNPIRYLIAPVRGGTAEGSKRAKEELEKRGIPETRIRIIEPDEPDPRAPPYSVMVRFEAAR